MTNADDWTRPADSDAPHAADSAASAVSSEPAVAVLEPTSDGPNAPGHAPRPSDSGGGSAAMLPVVGLMLMALGALVVALIVFVQRDTSAKYPSNRGDGDYDLQAMALRSADVPAGMELRARADFDNDEWTGVLASGQDDPDAAERIRGQLVGQKRIRNLVSAFGWADPQELHLGETGAILSQSTLYESAAAASADTNRLCGLQINEKPPFEEFSVPKIGDQAVGFRVESKQIVSEDGSFARSHQTVLCFRTGRIVHAVVQSGWRGTENIALVVLLAERMLDRVDKTFEGKPDEKDKDPQRAG